jgi:hypothetical protein
MIEMIRNILEGALDRLHHEVTLYVPSLLAALTLILGAYLTALLIRWLIYKIFKGLAIDKFLRQSGVAFLVDPSGRLRATRVAGEGAFWCIVITGLLMGLNVFNTDLTTQIVQKFVFLLPKLVVAGLILLSGTWLGQYLGRSMLVWAVNENLPFPRRMATAVRIVITFVAIVVAADQLDFARSVFLAAFIILVGGAVLTASLAIGLGQYGLRRYSDKANESEERSLWSHL